MLTDLWDLQFHFESNESDEKFDDLENFIYTYDLAFPLAKLVSLGYVDFDTLPEKSLDEISETWTKAMESDFFSTPWG